VLILASKLTVRYKVDMSEQQISLSNSRERITRRVRMISSASMLLVGGAGLIAIGTAVHSSHKAETSIQQSEGETVVGAESNTENSADGIDWGSILTVTGVGLAARGVGRTLYFCRRRDEENEPNSPPDSIVYNAVALISRPKEK
jgi:hypothetical protein